MANLNFEWHAELNKSKYNGEDQSLHIEGVLLDDSVNKNGWAVDLDDFPNLTKQIPDTQLRIDHGKSVRDIVGGLTAGKHDIANNKITFEADIDDSDIIKKVMKGRVRHVSIGAEADAYCSKCGGSVRPVKACKCEGAHTVIKNVKLKEVSIISEPAFNTAKFVPISFTASVERALAQSLNVEKIEEDEGKMVKEEAKKEETIKAEPVKEEVAKEECPVCGKKDTEKKPAGGSSVVLVSKEEFESFKQEMFSKMEQLLAMKVPPLKKEDEEDEKKKEVKTESEDERIKKVVKEAVGQIMREAKKPEEEEKKKEEKKESEDETKTKKEPVTAGAKVDIKEDVEASSVGSGNLFNAAWEDIVKDAKKYHIMA